MSQDDLESLEGVQKIPFELTKIETGVDLVSFLAETKIFPSKGEARKMVTGGGVSINRKKAETVDFTVNEAMLLHQKYILVQKGKKSYFLVVCA